MKLRVIAAVGLVLAVVGSADAKTAKSVTVFEDASGDAGNQDSGIPGFAEAGFDLLKGEIAKEGKGLRFTVTHSGMASSGTPGEAFRLIWSIAIDGTQYEMTVKSLDIGKPDVIATAMGQDPNGEERVGSVYMGVARFEECGLISAGINWSQCEVIGYYDAVFDPTNKTASWVIDLETMKAKKGSVIAGGSGGRSTTGCMICWVPQYLERSLTPQSIIDSAVMSVAYKVR